MPEELHMTSMNAPVERTLEEREHPRELMATIALKEARIAELEREVDERLLGLKTIQAQVDSLREELEARGRGLRELAAVIAARDGRIAELEREWQSGLKTIRHAAKMAIIAIKANLIAWFGPRLGVLRQYPPRPLYIPGDYVYPAQAGKPPRISIVTPSFNQAIYLERTIRSVIEQSYSNFEYIVQDGGSADQSKDVIERYADTLTHWESVRDRGQAHAINLGFQHATGEIMAYLNSDDVLLPGTLAYVAEYFRRHPEVDVLYGHRIIVDEEDREIGRWVLPRHSDEVLSWTDFVPQESLFWRRPIWDKVGGHIDESFEFAIDWDLLLRFRDAGAKFVRLPRFLAAFRVHALQKTSAHIGDIGLREMDRLRQRCHGRTVSPQEVMDGVASYVALHILHDKWARFRRH